MPTTGIKAKKIVHKILVDCSRSGRFQIFTIKKQIAKRQTSVKQVKKIKPELGVNSSIFYKLLLKM